MDAGACATCQSHLGDVDTDGMLGLFPRVRCGACGFVNVLLTTGGMTPEAPGMRAEGGTVAAIVPPAFHDPVDVEPDMEIEEQPYGAEATRVSIEAPEVEEEN